MSDVPGGSSADSLRSLRVRRALTWAGGIAGFVLLIVLYLLPALKRHRVPDGLVISFYGMACSGLGSLVGSLAGRLYGCFVDR